MAFAALSVHGQDPQDTTADVISLSQEEEEAVEEEESCDGYGYGDGDHGEEMDSTCSSSSSSSSSMTHLLLLQKRISQTYPHHLSPQALLLLGQASCHPPQLVPPNPTIDSLTPLYSQLESLRDLIPLQPTQVGENFPSCLITGALDYIEQMNREIQRLHEGIQKASYSSSASYKYDYQPPSCYNYDDQPPSSTVDARFKGQVKVEDMSNCSFHVHVHCKKRKGLLTSLLKAIESLGMVIDRMDVSCNPMLMLDVIITSQVKQKRRDGNSVEQVLLSTISKGVQNP